MQTPHNFSPKAEVVSSQMIDQVQVAKSRMPYSYASYFRIIAPEKYFFFALGQCLVSQMLENAPNAGNPAKLLVAREVLMLLLFRI